MQEEMKYKVIKNCVWVNRKTGQRVSPMGCLPDDGPDWEMKVEGFTVRNPHTNETGMCMPPWKTEAEAQAWADVNVPSRYLMYD